jgi:16S rRNA (uracil1498-N3)-methyltransferase
VRLTRVHVAAPLAAGILLTLPEAAAAHVARVLRLGPGDGLVVFDGRGVEHEATIEAVRGGAVQARVGPARQGLAASRLRLTLVQGIARGERMDFAVQKATELGVSRLVPLRADNSVVRLNAETAPRKRAHWLGVAAAACEQCGRSLLPAVDAPLALAEWLAVERDEDLGDLRLVLDPGAAAGLAGLATPSGGITLLVGPEGGLSPAELALACREGYRPVRLGPRVLRTETAALAALAALQTLYGDLTE